MCAVTSESSSGFQVVHCHVKLIGYHSGHRGRQIPHCVDNFLSFCSIFLKLGTNKDLVTVHNLALCPPCIIVN